MNTLHFYAVIIGTEILNGRRSDKHFAFVQQCLAAQGHTLFASLVIKDDAALIEATYGMVKRDPDAVMFSFGGIGSTPDDLTRAVAARVFTGAPLQRHFSFERDIIERFGAEAYPHRIHMADLPRDAALLKNPVNNMSGFALSARYFFVPGFPEMAHPMIDEAVRRYFPGTRKTLRRTLLAETGENTLIGVMEQMPDTVEFSSLPMYRDGKPRVEISVAGTDAAQVEESFELFTRFLDSHRIAYMIP